MNPYLKSKSDLQTYKLAQETCEKNSLNSFSKNMDQSLEKEIQSRNLENIKRRIFPQLKKETQTKESDLLGFSEYEIEEEVEYRDKENKS